MVERQSKEEHEKLAAAVRTFEAQQLEAERALDQRHVSLADANRELEQRLLDFEEKTRSHEAELNARCTEFDKSVASLQQDRLLFEKQCEEDTKARVEIEKARHEVEADRAKLYACIRNLGFSQQAPVSTLMSNTTLGPPMGAPPDTSRAMARHGSSQTTPQTHTTTIPASAHEKDGPHEQENDHVPTRVERPSSGSKRSKSTCARSGTYGISGARARSETYGISVAKRSSTSHNPRSKSGPSRYEDEVDDGKGESDSEGEEESDADDVVSILRFGNDWDDPMEGDESDVDDDSMDDDNFLHPVRRTKRALCTVLRVCFDIPMDIAWLKKLPATLEEVEAFELEKGPGPSAADFRPYPDYGWKERMWNRELIDIVKEKLVDHCEEHETRVDSLADYFKNLIEKKFDRCFAKLRKMLPQEGETLEQAHQRNVREYNDALAKARTTSNCRAKYKRRLDTIERCRDLKRKSRGRLGKTLLKAVSTYLKVGKHACVSSDEEQVDAIGNKVRCKKLLAWRPAEVNYAMLVVDNLRNIPGAYSNRGSKPAPSAPGFRISDRPIPCQLPISFYDPQWYRALSHCEKKRLGATQDDYG
ncbi:hypothetical protein BV20DRAFT_1053914 [Pilatotrama ljubarskyi]|nr:hypothetical protein BV20DRAFT_1053914 [Pilatotrama ljubarskyi]